MHQHDQSPSPDVVDQPGETNESNGGYVVNYLLFEILWRKTRDKKRHKNGLQHCLVIYWSGCQDWSLIDSMCQTEFGFTND